MKESILESYYRTEDPEEIAREKKKAEGILSLLPLTSGGGVDKTNYVLLNNNKEKTPPDINNTSPKKGHVGFGTDNKNEHSINPWILEKNFDQLQTFNLARPTGGYRTINYERPTYSSKESFESLNQAKFDSVIGYSFGFEGGYTNRKEDWETNFGITAPFLEDYKHALPGGKSKPISELTKDEARLLYKAQWDKYNLGYIRNKDLALLLNDYMINSYAKNVAKRVQNILNSNGANLKTDGIFGKETLNAINNVDKEWLIEQILIDRLERYQSTLDSEPQKEIYIKGWIRRLNELAAATRSRIRFKETDLKIK